MWSRISGGFQSLTTNSPSDMTDEIIVEQDRTDIDLEKIIKPHLIIAPFAIFRDRVIRFRRSDNFDLK